MRTRSAFNRLSFVSLLSVLATGASAGDNNSYIAQRGNDNLARIDQQSSTGNSVARPSSLARQIGDRNTLLATQKDTGNSIAKTDGTEIVQRGDSNFIDIHQSAADNSVNTVRQISLLAPNSSSLTNKLYINQAGGRGNLVSDVMQTWVPSRQATRPNLISVEQIGNRNIIDGILQSGTGNSFSLDSSGDGNFARSNQVGVGNVIKLALHGDENHVNTLQIGHSNQINVALTGTSNNQIPSFTVPNGSLPLSLVNPMDLNPGEVIQIGSDNSISLDVGGLAPSSAGNSFAFAQHGLSNRIEGSINGNANQVVVTQEGRNHFTSFIQTGNFNVIGVSQR